MARAFFKAPLWQAIAGLGVASLVLAGCTVSSTTPAPTPTATSPATPIHQAALSTVSQSGSGVDATAEDITVSATCPAGKVLVGGGYHLQLGNREQLISIRANYPSAVNTWTVSEANPQSGGAVTLTAYALCLTASAPVTTSIARATSVDGKGAAACPAGRTLVGGGFSWPALVGSGAISASYPSSGGWQVSGSPPPVQNYTVYAVCASGLTARTISTATTTIANNAEGETYASCGSSALMVGGGYATDSPRYYVSEDNRASDNLTRWMARWLNLYAPDLSGPGPTPTPPPPIQLTSYGICVTPA